MRKNKGFTLVEILIVVVILGILAAVLVPKVMDRPDQARIIKARQDIRALEAALAQIGTPAILKTRRFGYDGKGQARIMDPIQADAALADAVDEVDVERITLGVERDQARRLALHKADRRRCRRHRGNTPWQP